MTPSHWFADDQFGRVHHRFLNHLPWLRSLTNHLSFEDSEFVDIAEGDLCWHEDGSDFRFFLKHPSMGTKIPSLTDVDRLIAAGDVPSLDDILSSEFSPLKLLIELKTGTGDWKKALRSAIETLEERAPGRYCIDSFNPAFLKEVKAISPGTLTSLHTRLGLLGSRVIVTHFEPPYFGLPDLAQLPQVDILTITYKYCAPRNLGVDMDKFLTPIFAQEKMVFFGGVTSLEEFDLVRHTEGTRAAYAKFLKDQYSSTPRKSPSE
ncbi:MAG: hypothetical protein AAGJ31_07120 [Verrucomicrobiota bacterium]